MTPTRGDAPRLWPPSFEAAIFDFDGTIASTAQIWHDVDRLFLGSRGLAFDEEYTRTLSLLGLERGARYTIDRFGLSETVEEVCAEWRRSSRALYKSQARLRPGAQAYIRALRSQGVPVALATTNDPEVLDAMRHVDVNGLFDVRVHGREVARPKDHPDIFLEAARRLGAEPSSCIVFEDLAVALRSARRAGMHTCGLRADDPLQDLEEVRQAADLLLLEWTDIAL